MADCADCGHRLYSDVCPWCHEELCIYGSEGDEGTIHSPEFMESVSEQREAVKKNKRIRELATPPKPQEDKP